jgi:hypothetical protein
MGGDLLWKQAVRWAQCLSALAKRAPPGLAAEASFNTPSYRIDELAQLFMENRRKGADCRKFELIGSINPSSAMWATNWTKSLGTIPTALTVALGTRIARTAG